MSEESSYEADDQVEVTVDPAITPELFHVWRSPRFGRANPERMNNPVWEWLVKSRVNAYQASELLHGPSAMDAGPGWCFDRFGQSSTRLPDDRVVFISGEHEDHYDPDFYIYNDVVVKHPNGCIDIFGYPRDVFPPTDFHSATLVGNRIVIIGNLGYPEDRQPTITQVLMLDLKTFAVTRVHTSEMAPGWLHRHRAKLSDDQRSILIEGGILDRREQNRSLVENIDDWSLGITDWRWQRLTERRWQRWEVRRKDRKPNHLWEIEQAIWKQQFGPPGDRQVTPSLEEQLGVPPDLNLAAQLYKPNVAFDEVPRLEEDAYGVHRIKIDGLIVRYVEDSHCIQLTVEGELPQQTADALTSDLVRKMSILENTACELIRL
jgi:hypothetical protein